jgi:hypothetical protein
VVMANRMSRLVMRLSLIGCAVAILAGCSLSNPTDNPFTVKANSNGKPTVWDCAMVQMSSPPRYGCSDNKTYTAFQLRDARLGLTPEQAAGKL